MDRAENDSYILRVLVSIDQLGNAVAGGNPDVTISARTGYFANIKKTRVRLWWRCVEAIIDFAFRPVDGPNHCLRAYRADEQEGNHREGNDIARAILGVFVILASFPISIITRVWVLLVPGSKYDSVNEEIT